MKLEIKTFDELTTRELYEILRLRSQIFVVEQRSIYQDLDYVDYDSAHLMLWNEDRLDAYMRIYQIEGDPEDFWKFGRVVTRKYGQGLGATILPKGYKYVYERNPNATIGIESQCQAQGFYEKFGFRPCSEPFVMDGLPHIKLKMKLASWKPEKER